MPYVKRKDGKNYLIQSIRRTDGTRGSRMLCYLGQARSVEEAIADLTEKYEIQRKLVRQLARKAPAAKATFQALDWKPPRPWAVKWVDGMPVPFHAQRTCPVRTRLQCSGTGRQRQTDASPRKPRRSSTPV